jgi:ATP-binding cassette subfamily F protein 3
MTVARLSGVEKSYGGWSVLRGLDLEVRDGARLGIVGPNGAGKSTILKILAGAEDVHAGDVTRRKGLTMAYLEQHVAGDDRTPVAHVVSARPEIAELTQALEACEAEMADPATSSDMRKLQRVLSRHEGLMERFVAEGGPGLEGEARSLLLRLGLEAAALDKPTKVLSGGQRKLAGLAACLVRDPGLLLLDEPETHLDPDRREVLEDAIDSFEGAVVVVSHDRFMLDETIDEIAELENGVVTMWQGNYSTFTLQREIAMKRQQELYVTQQKEIARLEEAIKRFKEWARIVVNERHIKQARNKQRQIDRMDKIDKPVFERRRIALDLYSKQRGGQKVVTLDGASVSFGDHEVLGPTDLVVVRGERVGVIGRNGAGKTVLARVLAGLLEPTAGERWSGPSIRVGYLAQTHAPVEKDETPISALRKTQAMYEDEAVKRLARFLFRYDEMRSPVAELSGGQRTRLELLLLMLRGANFLVLDEPTNHLDIESMEVLEDATERFDGTVVVVSHDRYLLDRIADRTIEVRDGRVLQFEGGYSYWREQTAESITA